MSYNVAVIEQVYSLGQFTCYKVTECLTAWIDDAWGGKRLILGWKFPRSEDGRIEAERTTGIVLYYEELLKLKDYFEDGSFAKAISEVSVPDTKQQRFWLGHGKISKPCVVVRCVPVYGVMISFWKFDHFVQISLKRLLKLLSFLDIHIIEKRPEYQRQHGVIEEREKKFSHPFCDFEGCWDRYLNLAMRCKHKGTEWENCEDDIDGCPEITAEQWAKARKNRAEIVEKRALREKRN